MKTSWRCLLKTKTKDVFKKFSRRLHQDECLLGCCLEIPEICKPRFSSRSCLNVCRLDSHFELWYSRRENVVSYLISTQFWSLENQNKSFLAPKTSWLSFSVKHFTLLMRAFSFFVSVFLQRSIWLDSGGPLLLKRNILSSELPEVAIHRCSRIFKLKRILRDAFSWNLKKYLGLVSFWAPLKSCFYIFQK